MRQLAANLLFAFLKARAKPNTKSDSSPGTVAAVGQKLPCWANFYFSNRLLGTPNIFGNFIMDRTVNRVSANRPILSIAHRPSIIMRHCIPKAITNYYENAESRLISRIVSHFGNAN